MPSVEGTRLDVCPHGFQVGEYCPSGQCGGSTAPAGIVRRQDTVGQRVDWLHSDVELERRGAELEKKILASIVETEKAIKVAVVGPDDVLVILVPYRISEQEFDTYMEALKALRPATLEGRVLVLAVPDGDISVSQFS